MCDKFYITFGHKNKADKLLRKSYINYRFIAHTNFRSLITKVKKLSEINKCNANECITRPPHVSVNERHN